MKKAIALVSLLIILGMAGCSAGTTSDVTTSSTTTTTAPNVELTVSAAASLTESMKTIAEQYKTIAPNVSITFNFGASGTLQTQIEEGAPVDLFLSAAQKQMDALADKDLIVTDTRKNLLVNKIVLIVPKDSTAGLTGFDDCLTDKVSLIAIGNPDSVPVGQYAKDVFTYLNGWDSILAKANLATDVKQVLAWTETGDVTCGVVYSTDAATSDKIKVVCEAPTGSHKAVIYPAALIKATTHQEAAKAFLDYLSTDAAKAIFTDNGFTFS
jgi:molybdate transport system substrate-binding protein